MVLDICSSIAKCQAAYVVDHKPADHVDVIGVRKIRSERVCGSLHLFHHRLGMFEVDLGCTRDMRKRNEHFLAALGITHGYVRHGTTTLAILCWFVNPGPLSLNSLRQNTWLRTLLQLLESQLRVTIGLAQPFFYWALFQLTSGMPPPQPRRHGSCGTAASEDAAADSHPLSTHCATQPRSDRLGLTPPHAGSTCSRALPVS